MSPPEGAGQPSEIYWRYALGLARRPGLSAADEEGSERAALLDELRRRGVRGRPDRMTLHTRGIPAGCRPCLAGRGSNLVVTGMCNRSCFFCFNPQPRIDETAVHGRRLDSLEEAPERLASLGVRSVGISGGEPLLYPERVLGLLSALRRRFGGSVRVDLYTNGDLLDEDMLARLKDAGLGSLRLNLAANGGNPAPLARALPYFPDAAVEMPAVPGQRARLEALMDELEDIGARYLILHELFACAQNEDSLRRLGHEAKPGAAGGKLMWGPVAGSEELILKLLLRSLEPSRKLSLYYCSCATQDWIAERSLARAARPPSAA